MTLRGLVLACIAVVGFAGSAVAASFDNVTVDRSTTLYSGEIFLQLDPFSGLSGSTFAPSILETGTGSFFSASLTYAPDASGFIDIFDAAAFPPVSPVAGPVDDLMRSVGLWEFLGIGKTKTKQKAV